MILRPPSIGTRQHPSTGSHGMAAILQDAQPYTRVARKPIVNRFGVESMSVDQELLIRSASNVSLSLAATGMASKSALANTASIRS